MSISARFDREKASERAERAADVRSEADRCRRAFRALVAAATALALLVIVFGAFVRLSDAGLGCPDWPGCYGHVAAPRSKAALERALASFPGAVIESRKASIEMAHRYLAGSLGLLVLAIATVAVRFRARLGRSPALPIALVMLIVVQALFGRWTVTWRLMPIVVTLHLLGGMSTLALLVWLLVRDHPRAQRERDDGFDVVRFGRWSSGALIALFVQIALGGWVSTNYAGMACPGVPLCEGAVVPEMRFAEAFSLWHEAGSTAGGAPLSGPALVAIQWTHRAGALVLLALVGIVGWRSLRAPPLRRLGLLAGRLVLLQAAIGITSVIFALPLPLAIAHNAVAALLSGVLVALRAVAASAPSGRE